jgi:hypothetical protein
MPMADDEEPGAFKGTVQAVGFLLLILALGLGSAGFWWKDWQLSNEAQHWPRADGIVVTSRLRASAGDELNRKYARIGYTYTIGIHRYQGEVSSPTWPFADAQEIAGQHARGTSVIVHYDPEDPSRSVLASWLSWNHIGWLVVAVFPLGFFVFLTFSWIKKGLSGASRS